MATPIESAEDLADQSEISYGTLSGGSTMTFFRFVNYKTQFTAHTKRWVGSPIKIDKILRSSQFGSILLITDPTLKAVTRNLFRCMYPYQFLDQFIS